MLADMRMNLDIPNLLVGTFLGFLAGIFSNMAFARYQDRQLRAKLKRKYEKIVGHYAAYPIGERSEEIVPGQQIGEVQITYEKENILRLQYREIHHDHAWEALLWMDTPHFGSMAWRYVRLGGREPPPEHRFGFKRCIAVEGVGRDNVARSFVYLVGHPTHGNEVLEKKG